MEIVAHAHGGWHVLERGQHYGLYTTRHEAVEYAEQLLAEGPVANSWSVAPMVRYSPDGLPRADHSSTAMLTSRLGTYG